MPCLSRALFCSEFEEDFIDILHNLEGLSHHQKRIIIARYVNVVVDAELEYKHSLFYFILLTNITTIGGVILISFLSLQKSQFVNRKVELILYWFSFILSILVTITSRMLYGFNLHKKYILNYQTMEKLEREGWKYLSIVEKYDIEDINERTTLFINQIEKIKQNKVEQFTNMENNIRRGESTASVEIREMRPNPPTNNTPMPRNENVNCLRQISQEPLNENSPV